jgi:integrase
LHLVGSGPVKHAPVSPLLALVALEPVRVLPGDFNLIAMANAAEPVLDLAVDVGEASAAQLALDWFIEYEGAHARTDGDRANSLASHLCRYVLPHLLEVALMAPGGARTVEDLRFAQAQDLATILAGRRPLPAATVASTTLKRNPVTCVWLTMQEAAAVCHGGLKAVSDACAEGRVVGRRTGRGPLIVLAADLRAAGLLIELSEPHGLLQSSAKNVLFVLKQAMQRAQDHGAALRGDYSRLYAIKPAGNDLARAKRVDPGYLPVSTTLEVATYLSVVHQVTLWVLRLTGMRIGEAFGLLVDDFFQTADGSWALRVEKQGGEWKLVRDGGTGRFAYQSFKEGTKTEQSMRTIRVPEMLADLLVQVVEVFHTRDGVVLTANRLIPGIGKDDASGMGSFRAALDAAQRAAGLTSSVPHDMRGFLITDHRNAGVEDRLGEYYVGHSEQKRTVHAGYDDGVPVELQHPATEAMATLLAGAGIERLIVPTEKRERWGRGTVLGRERSELLERMAARGWLGRPAWAPTHVGLLTTTEVASRLGKSEHAIRRLLVAGTLRGRKDLVGGVKTWLVGEDDLEVCRASAAGTSIRQLAERLQLTYHQTRELCLKLGVLVEERPARSAILLGPDAVATVMAEVQRRREQASGLVDLAEAARRLGLPLGQVEKLERSGELAARPDPRGGRRRHVTVQSVQEHARRMAVHRTEGEESYVPFDAARRSLGLTRNGLSELIGLGLLSAATYNRRQHVGERSLREYAARHGVPESRLASLPVVAVAAVA